jgi:arylformamidase
VGEHEGAEYHRQSQVIVERWRQHGARTCFEVPAGTNHFTVIAPFAEPNAHAVRRIAALAKSDR